ncbi:MAG: Hsp20/alpha crystallin family protein [Herpetosiphon sp.]
MATIAPFAPWKDLVGMTDVMNTLFDDRLSSRVAGYDQSLPVPLNIAETSNGFLIQVAVPGVTPEDLDVTFQNNAVTISGEFKQPQWTDGKEKPIFHRLEWRAGRFARAISFPTHIEVDGVQTQLTNGVLSIFVPKAEAAKPRKVQIASGAVEGNETKSFAATT